MAALTDAQLQKVVELLRVTEQHNIYDIELIEEGFRTDAYELPALLKFRISDQDGEYTVDKFGKALKRIWQKVE